MGSIRKGDKILDFTRGYDDVIRRLENGRAKACSLGRARMKKDGFEYKGNGWQWRKIEGSGR